MPFKIVQTIEKGENKLTAVPHQWEINSLLYWPKSVKQEKLRKDENSVVDYNKWSQINCIVKRKNIETFNEAEDEIDAMSNNSETGTDTENQPPNKIKRLPNTTFNDMAKAASTSTKTQSTERPIYVQINENYPDIQNVRQDTSASVTRGTEIAKANSLPIIQTASTSSKTQSTENPIYVQINEKDLIFQSVSLQEELKENENAGTVLVTEIEAESKSILREIKTIKNDIQMVKNDIKTVTENQSILSCNQNTIIAQISELSIKFEEFIKLSLSTKKNTKPGEFGPLKIYNQENLEEFERKLDKPDSRHELYRQYSVILNPGVGKGTTNAYTLVDAMFDRKFFTQCSWTGVSKGDATKICFKGFTKTLNFFFDVVHESDNTFNKTQLIKFFKIILRNARYRSQNEQSRMSAQRQKQKGKPKTKRSLPVSLQDNLENHPLDENERELPDIEGEINQPHSAPLHQENQQNKSADDDGEVVDNDN